MPSLSTELWWALGLGTVVFLALASTIITIIVLNQRRFLASQKKQWEEIKKREEQYRDLFNNVSDIVYIHSIDGKIIQLNLAVTRSLGYDIKEVTGKYLKDFVGNQYHHKIDEYLNDLQTEGETSGLFYFTSKEGNECIFEFRSSIVSKNGESTSVRGIARNVTEQKQAEKALRESEERFRRLLKYSPIPIGVHSGGKWVYVNDAGLGILAANQIDDVVGKPLLHFVKAEERKIVRNRIRKVIRESYEATRLQEKILRLDGREIEVEIVAIPIVYDNRPAGQVVVRDITEQKRLQDELARAQRLETAGRVAGQIAHDFNNLLAPLTAYPTLIREKLHNQHPVLELVDEMESAADKIAEINQQLLTLSRRGHYAMDVVDINDLIRKILRTQRLPAEIAVILDLQEDLLKIKGGVAQLTRALTNLIRNAQEAMQDIGVLTIITENVYLDQPLKGYQTVKQGEYVKLSISDNGAGIVNEIMDNIFDPFFTTKKMDRMRGSGLGLSIVHGILEDHNGYIIVDTQLGKGTTFSLYFITSRDFDHTNGDINELKTGHGERILVVDDDPIQRSVADNLLKRLGYEVHSVQSGEEAVNYVKENPQDLLLLDMVMNGIDGVETFRQILEFQSDQKALILSGYAMSERVQEALSLGVGGFVAKPVTPNVLANAIQKELHKSDAKNDGHS